MEKMRLKAGFPFLKQHHIEFSFLQSGQVKRIPKDCVNEFIIRRLNPLVVVDFSFMSALLYMS